MQLKALFSKLMIICPALLLPSFAHAGAAEELQKAKFEERAHSEEAAFDAAMDGLRKFPNDRNLFLYALDLSSYANKSQLTSLETTASSMGKKYPKDYVWNLGICKIKRMKSKPDEGLQNCLKAMQYGKGEFKPNLEAAKTYMAMGIYDRAEELISSALEINPTDFEALYSKGEIYEAQDLFIKAKKAYATALASAGEDISAKADANAAKASAAMKRVSNRQKKTNSMATAKKAKENKGEEAVACMKKFNEEAEKEDFIAAAATGRRCRKIDNRNLELASKLADVLVNAGEYEEAIDEYERAQKLTGNEHAKHARLCIKEAETLIRLEDRSAADQKYRMAAAAAPFDEKILLEVADYFLAQSMYKEALHYFSLVIQISPNNREAIINADKLKVDLMSDEEILEELKTRGAVNQRTTVDMLSEEHLRLHRNIRAAEANGAVEVVRGKFPGRPGLYYEDSENGLKFRLTMQGYNAYARTVSRDALKFFEKKGINLREIFKLRDTNGDLIFDKNGQITPEGINAWSEAASTGKITWIFSYQPVPGSRKQIKASREITSLVKEGYREISEAEYFWLLKATNCPDHVLKGDQVKLKEINDGAMTHYLLCYIENSGCMNPINKGLPSYIKRYRNGDTSVSSGKSTSFFGTGGVKQYRFCEEGKIWMN